MNRCNYCGDRYPDSDVHNCWLRVKELIQENLPAPVPTDYSPLGRPIETDADWYTNHGHAD